MDLLESKEEVIEKYLSTGCDERIFTNEKGQLKYWIDPTDTTLINRGSCTCNAITKEGLEIVEELLDQDLNDQQQFENLVAEQTAALKSLINFEDTDKFEVFYGPSGTDLVFYPILISRILNPGKPILNIVSCPEELGSGTALASKGLYHCEYNQFEEAVPKGNAVLDDQDIKVIDLNARSKSGEIINHNAYIKELIESFPNHSIVINLVYGSKSGIEDNLNIIDEIDRPDIIWTVDMCQFRHSRKIIHRLLDRHALVYLTGSKFYQAPPFCGAMLMSTSFFDRIASADWSDAQGFIQVFSVYDFPLSLKDRIDLPARRNVSLRLRWACAIEEMKRFKTTDRDLINQKISDWNRFVNQRMKDSDVFELMPDQSFTNDTIISFRVKQAGRYLDHLELKKLHREIATDQSHAALEFRNVFIGQPVAYGDRSFLRLAIGASNIQTFIQEDESRFELDGLIIDFIASKVDQFVSDQA